MLYILSSFRYAQVSWSRGKPTSYLRHNKERGPIRRALIRLLQNNFYSLKIDLLKILQICFFTVRQNNDWYIEGKKYLKVVGLKGSEQVEITGRRR